MSQIDDVTKEIINAFVSEGYERLEDAESRIPDLEQNADPEVLNTIFRLFHSIKGSAGYLNFENIKSVTHEAETLLDIFRKGGKSPGSTDVDLLYQTMDFLKQLIQNVEKHLTDQGLEAEANLMIHSISESIRNLKDEQAAAAILQPAPVEKAPDNPAEKTEPVAVHSDTGFDQLITPEMVSKFCEESADLLEQSEQCVLALDKDPKNIELVQQIFRNIHTLKGNSGFFGFEYLEKDCMEFENLLDSLRKGRTEPNANTVSLMLKALDQIKMMIKNVAQGKRDNVKEDYKPLGEILVMIGAVKQEEVQEALKNQAKPLGEILVDSGTVSRQDVDKALEIQQKAAVSEAPAQGMTDFQKKEIRVDTARLDTLFDLVGELITAQAAVGNNPDLEGLELHNFNKSFNTLNKISREIQELTMMIRMIPLEGLFTRMIRLVRDLSRKFEKQIDFHVSGKETEMDKNVIEQISDPLVHIIRNSIDHGIESPEIRLQQGKPETGQINLSAHYEGSEIWITIKDDGQGMNRDKILAKARERGLLKTDPSLLTDEEVWKFIFEPGFSTAEKVSEVSGRGVGMDVVKKNMEKIRGKVSVKSQPGKGSEIILQIPLTMVIMDGITVKVGTNFYSIPLMDILEFFKLKTDQLTETEAGKEVVDLRGEMIPLVRLWDIFQISQHKSDLDGIIIVVIVGGRKFCLLIDDIIGNQQIVVKSLSDYLGKIEGIMGCSVLGTGQVSFILDTRALVNRVIDVL